ERQAHEAEPEALQLVRFSIGLDEPASAFGKDHYAFAALEELAAVLRRSDHGTGTRHEDVEERDRGQKELAETAREPRRIRLEKYRRTDHRRVPSERIARVVGDDEHRAFGGKILEAVGLHTKPV